MAKIGKRLTAAQTTPEASQSAPWRPARKTGLPLSPQSSTSPSNYPRPPRNTADHWPTHCLRGGPNEHDGFVAETRRYARPQTTDGQNSSGSTEPHCPTPQTSRKHLALAVSDVSERWCLRVAFLRHNVRAKLAPTA